jgi:hypothetical protein
MTVYDGMQRVGIGKKVSQTPDASSSGIPPFEQPKGGAPGRKARARCLRSWNPTFRKTAKRGAPGQSLLEEFGNVGSHRPYFTPGETPKIEGIVESHVSKTAKRGAPGVKFPESWSSTSLANATVQKHRPEEVCP